MSVYRTIGPLFFLALTFSLVVHADAFGVHAVNCFLGNNEALNNAALPLTDRSVQVIQDG